MKQKFLLSVLFIIFCFTSDIFAVGALFSRPRWSSEEYKKMWIQKVNTTVEIRDQIAVTHVDQTFFNELDNSVEAIYIFPLPEDATMIELYYWFNGKRYKASVRERQEAVKDYNEKLRQWLDPALLEDLGNNLFRLSIVPINPLSEVRTEISYVEPLKYETGIVKYKFQLNTLELSSKPLQLVSLNLDLQTQTAIKSFTSPSHSSSTATSIKQLSDKHYTLFFGDENFTPDKDLLVEFELSRDNVNYSILTYKPSVQDSIGNDSYYTLWITPPDNLTDNQTIPQDIVFTADISSSMEGTRISQLKEALSDFLKLLRPIDRFNIVTFGTFVKKFKEDLIQATSENIELAKTFVEELYALGMTNIDEALKTSLAQSYEDSTSNSLVFLTDGYPTWGEKNIDSLVNRTKRMNNKDIRVFSFGIGTDISRILLSRLAAENKGYATFITSDDSIALIINDYFKKISKPVLTDIKIDFGGQQVIDIYPKEINDLFWGSQLMQMGIYKKAGYFNVKVSGRFRKDSVNFEQQVYFPDTIGGHKFVPRLWAKAKINYILDLIKVYGETKELVDQVIELSLRFQILTPYTAFYVDPTTGMKDKENVPGKFNLAQNYPNPFNPSTTIKYSLPAGQPIYHIVIKIYDILGKLIITLVDTDLAPGEYSVVWNGKNSNGISVPSGTYFYTIEAGDFKQTQKMILLK